MSQGGGESPDGCMEEADREFKQASDVLVKLTGTRGALQKVTLDDLNVLKRVTKGLHARVGSAHQTIHQLSDMNLELKSEIEKMKKEMEDIKSKQTASYAAAAAAGIPDIPSRDVTKTPKHRDPHCVIKVIPKLNPNTGQLSTASSVATKKALGHKLLGSGVGVTALWMTNNKGVSVSCRTREEADKLIGVVNQQMAHDFVAEKQKPRNPVVTILLTSEEYAERESFPKLLEDILDKNKFLANTDENPLKIVHGYITRQGNSIVVLEMGARNFQQLKLAGNRLFAGIDYCRARERDPVSQCFNCQRFGHKASSKGTLTCRFEINGKQAKRCARCGGDHQVGVGDKRCTAPICCSNCKEHNVFMKGRTAFPTDHEAIDQKCPVRLRAERRAREMIDYGTM